MRKVILAVLAVSALLSAGCKCCRKRETVYIPPPEPPVYVPPVPR